MNVAVFVRLVWVLSLHILPEIINTLSTQLILIMIDVKHQKISHQLFIKVGTKLWVLLKERRFYWYMVGFWLKIITTLSNQLRLVF